MRKTMTMRRLEQAGLAYRTSTYDAGLRDAREVAVALGVPPARMFKTLVVHSRHCRLG